VASGTALLDRSAALSASPSDRGSHGRDLGRAHQCRTHPRADARHHLKHGHRTHRLGSWSLLAPRTAAGSRSPPHTRTHFRPRISARTCTWLRTAPSLPRSWPRSWPRSAPCAKTTHAHNTQPPHHPSSLSSSLRASRSLSPSRSPCGGDACHHEPRRPPHAAQTARHAARHFR